jgi:hypothetical protein
MCATAATTRNAGLLLLLAFDGLLLTAPARIEGLSKILLMVAGPTCRCQCWDMPQFSHAADDLANLLL